MFATALGAPSAPWLHAGRRASLRKLHTGSGPTLVVSTPLSFGTHQRRECVFKPTSLAATGGPPGPTDGGAGNSGGGDGGGDSQGDGQNSSPKNSLLKGWEDRIAADPQFTYKVFVEQVIGVGAAVLGDMSSRPYWGLYELDFVFCTVIVGSIVNLSLMYLLAPTVSSTAGKSMGLIQKLFSEQILQSWGAPTGHMFERGYPFASRIVNLGYKGFLFAFVGMCAGLTGTAISNTLLVLRQKLDPNFKSQNEAPNVPLNAATWAAHMGISSNVRYQVLNGLDMVAQPSMSPLVFKIFTSVLRTANNVVGGISFVTLAKLFGVQSSKGDEVKQVAQNKA
ncbi:hypothetical protein ABBQ38_003037 [Trebouxia sp. C0009 RCD-2024]